MASGRAGETRSTDGGGRSGGGPRSRSGENDDGQEGGKSFSGFEKSLLKGSAGGGVEMKRGKAGEGTQTRLHFPFFPGRLKYSDEEEGKRGRPRVLNCKRGLTPSYNKA